MKEAPDFGSGPSSLLPGGQENDIGRACQGLYAREPNNHGILHSVGGDVPRGPGEIQYSEDAMTKWSRKIFPVELRCLWVAAVSIATSIPGYSATRIVDGSGNADHDTIYEAIVASSVGDTIFVAPERYDDFHPMVAPAWTRDVIAIFPHFSDRPHKWGKITKKPIGVQGNYLL